MADLTRHFSVELSKIAEAGAKEKRKGYAAALAATAPVAVAQAASEGPKGWIDKKVENATARKLGVQAKDKVKPWRTAVGRSAGRLTGGVATAPVFFSGIDDVRKGEKKKGYAKIVGSSGVYSGVKGATEAVAEGGGKAAVRKKLSGMVRARGALGIAGGVATAGAVAGSGKNTKEKDSVKNRVLKPAAAGTAIGAVKGGLEDVAIRGKGATRKTVAAKATGRAASGAMGALVISEIARKLREQKGKEKKSSVGTPPIPGSAPLQVTPTHAEIYTSVRREAEVQPTEDLQRFLQGQKKPEDTPTRRAVTYAVNDELRSRGVQVEPEKIRSKTEDPQPPGGLSLLHTAAAAAIISAPTLAWSAGIGQVSKRQEDVILRDSLDKMIASDGIERIQAGLNLFDSLNFDTASPDGFYLSIEDGDRPDVIKELQEQAGKSRTTAGRRRALDMAEKIRSGKKHFISAHPQGNPAILAHEYGHASAGALRRKTIASSASQIVHNAARFPAIALPLLALDSAADGSFHTKEELEAKAKFSEGVGALTTLIAAPYLAEEATASVKGLNAMRRAGAKPMQMIRGGALLGLAGSTYLAPFATGVVAAKILRSKIPDEDSTR